MSTDLVVRTPEPLTTKQLDYIKDTDFVPKAYRGNLPAIMAAVVTGREYGMGDMQALRLIDVIDGRPELRAEAKLMLARRAGHSITGNVKDEGASVTGKRADNGDTLTIDYTLEDAEKAGLLGKANWKKHPKEMLWARAVGILCKRLFGDVVPALADQYENELIAEAEEEASLDAATVLPSIDVAALEGEGAGEPHALATAEGAGAETTPPAEAPAPSPPPDDVAFEAATLTIITKGEHEGKTIDQVAAAPRGKHWLAWCAGQGDDHPQSAAAAAYLKATEGEA